MASVATPSRSVGSFPYEYVLLAFGFTWLFWWPAALGERGVFAAPPGLVLVGTLGPLVAAVVLTAREGGHAGLGSLLRGLRRWRVGPVWYGVVLLGPVLLQLCAMAAHVLLGGRPPGPLAFAGSLPLVLVLSAYFVVAVALPEEVGWRAYMLPWLQERHGALVASVILGSVWALWHLPLFFNPATLYGKLPFALYLAFLVPFAVLLTWVFNSTGGSLLMAVLLHATLNASSETWKVLPGYSGGLDAAEAADATAHVNLMVAIALWAAAVAVTLVYGPRDLSRRPRQRRAGPDH